MGRRAVTHLLFPDLRPTAARAVEAGDPFLDDRVLLGRDHWELQGVDRLAQVASAVRRLPSAQIVNAIVRETAEFCESPDYADDFTLTNLTLTYVSASKRLEIAASLYNLFDVEYAFPGFGGHVQDTIEQDGRTFWVGLTYRF